MQQVTKNQFIQVLHSYPESTTEDAREVILLKDSYPYSQVLHALAARLSKDHGLATQQRELQMAAIYSADRTVLKDVMTKKSIPSWPISHETTGTQHAETPLSISALKPQAEQRNESAGDVADQVIHDLNRLHELKHNFESMFVDTDQTAIKNPEENEDAVDTKTSETNQQKKLPGGRKPGNPKAKRIVELAKELDTEDTEDSTPGEIIKETIIEEIKSSKKKIKPETEKQREQLQIINQFIKAQPTISNPKEKMAVTLAGDLSSIKSGEFSDQIISETLVEILLNQGKKDKAIEVLKKLIWKFPQKKSYFAAQIEELKK